MWWSPRSRLLVDWLLSKTAVTAPIIGTTRPEHLDDAIAALDLHLDDSETSPLEAGYRPHRIRGHQ
jgi:aryl-alcohol dehydrogenase (NADP+)